MDRVREGDIYRILTIAGKEFPIYYGYYSEQERDCWDPTPIYPDFLSNPEYTPDGRPYARADQDICPHYTPRPKISGEDWCNDCCHFCAGEELIGVCHCPFRQQTGD